MKIEGLKIQYTLTDADRLDYGAQLSRALKELDELDQDQKEVVANFKSKKETVKSNIEKISEALRVGWIHKSFSGHKRKNYETGEWEYLSPDGFVVKREKFSPSDYQMTTDDVKDPEVGDPDGEDADLDALEARINKDEDPEGGEPQEEQPLGEDIPVVYPGADYMPEPDFTLEPEKPARSAGGKFKKKTP